MRYYAEQADGFRPAKLTISKETGIKTPKIKDTRRKLMKLSLIDFQVEPDHYVFVNWTVIHGFAMLEKPIEVGGRAYRNFRQPSLERYLNHPGNKRKQRINEVFFQLSSDQCIEYLAGLSEDEYEDVKQVIRMIEKECHEQEEKDRWSRLRTT